MEENLNISTDYKTDNYELVISKSTEDDRNIYSVVNFKYDVVEFEDYIFPRALEAMVNLQEKYQESIRQYNSLAEKVPESASIVGTIKRH